MKRALQGEKMKKNIRLLLAIFLIYISCFIFTACGNSDDGVVYAVSADNTYVEVVDYVGDSATVSIKSEYKGKPVTRIGNGAFDSCHYLKSIEIPDSVTSIGDRAFTYCSNLTEIIIPDSVTSMGYEVFDSSTRLSYNLDNGLKYIGNGDNPYLYLIGTTTTDISSVAVNNKCRFIGSYAFADCVSLTSIEMPDSVVYIDNSAFDNCKSLTNIQLPKNLTVIGDCAFSGCQRLASITLPEQLTKIDYAAFAHCYSLTTVTIGNNVTTIGDRAFAWCESLKSVVIPSAVTDILDCAFLDCLRLKEVNYLGTIDQWVQINFESNTSNPLAQNADLYIDGKLVTEAKIFEATNINNYSFMGCSSLTSVILGNSITSIDYAAFNGCGSLTSVILGNNITTIHEAAFNGCKSLTSIVIPSSVMVMGGGAFVGCKNLTIYCEVESEPPVWDYNWNPEECTVIWGYKKDRTN